MTLLSEISITIDTREQNQKRINAVESWAIKHGAIVEHSALKLCDYKIEGTFNEVDVCLGIEAKSWDNFLSDKIDDMEDKLVRSQEIYTEVALFIETGNYSFNVQENGHCNLNHTNPMLDKDHYEDHVLVPALSTKTLAAFEGFCDTLQRSGIHVRQLRSEAHFPYAIFNLLTYLQTPHKIKVKYLSYKEWLINQYTSIPEVGYVRAKKLIENYPNPFWVCSASEDSLIEVLGRTTGQVVYQHLHNHEFETPEWKNGYHRDGTPKDEPLPEEQEDIDNKVKSAIVDYLKGFSEGRTIEETCLHFNLPQGDFDRQTLHDYIKELAVEGKITSMHSGLFIVAPEIPIPEASAYDRKPQRYTEIPANKTQRDGTPLNPEISSYLCTDSSMQSPPIHNQTVPDNPRDASKEAGSHISTPPGDTICKFASEEKRASCTTPDHFKDTTSKVPQDKKMSLTEHLKVWFQEPHSMMETQLMYGLEGKAGAWSSKSVFDAVLAGEKSGYLRVFPQKGDRYYVVAVKAEKEMDIGL